MMLALSSGRGSSGALEGRADRAPEGAISSSQKAWGKAEEEQLAAECHQRVEAAVERYLAMGPRAPETMFDHLYAELPKAYVRAAR